MRLSTGFENKGLLKFLKVMIKKGVVGVSSVQISSRVQLYTDNAITSNKTIFFYHSWFLGILIFFPKVQHFLRDMFENISTACVLVTL